MAVPKPQPTEQIELADARPVAGPPQIDLAPTTTGVFSDPKYRQQKAEKFALGTGMSPVTVDSQLESGSERALRYEVANSEELKRRETKNEMLYDFASKLDRPLNSKDLDELDNLIRANPKIDPETVLEETYGNAFSKLMVDTVKDPTAHREVMNTMPDAAMDGMDAVGQAVAKREIASDVLQELQTEFDQIGENFTIGNVAKELGSVVIERLNPFIGSTTPYEDKPSLRLAGDFGEMFLPGYANVALGGFRWSTGDSLKEQYTALAMMPPSEFKQAFREAVQQIRGNNALGTDNLPLALQFAQGYLQYSNSDQFLDNWFGYADWVSLGATTIAAKIRAIKNFRRVNIKTPIEVVKPPPKTGPAGSLPKPEEKVVPDPTPQEELQNVKDFRTALKDTVKASNSTEPEEAAETLGDIDLAAELRVNKEILDKLDALDPFGDAVPLRNKLPGLFYPHEIGKTTGTLTREKADRLLAHAVRNANTILKGMLNNHNVTRLTEEQLKKAIELGKAQMAKQYGHAQDALLDVGSGGPFRVYSPDEQLLNVHTLEMRLGELPPAPKQPTQKDVSKGNLDRLFDYVSETDNIPRGQVVQDAKKGYHETYQLYQSTQRDLPPWEDYQNFLDFVNQQGNLTGQFGRLVQEITARTKKPLTKNQLASIQKQLNLPPSPTGDEFLDAVQAATSYKGPVLVRDLYDSMKVVGSFTGDLGTFRQKISDLRKAGKIKMSPFEGQVPNRAAPRKPKNVTGLGTDNEPLFRSTAKQFGYLDANEVRTQLDNDIQNLDEAFRSLRADDAGEGPDSLFAGRSTPEVLAELTKDNNLDALEGVGTLKHVLLQLQKAGKATAQRIQQIIEPQATRPTAPVEEGNFASEFKRDIGYGNETYRNRIIDSEFVVKKRTIENSPRRVHYVEAPKGFGPQVKQAKPNPYTPNPYPKAQVKNEEDLMTALAGLSGMIAKTENHELYNRVNKFLDKVERRQLDLRQNIGRDTRELDPSFLGSPYGVIPSAEQTVEARRAASRPKKGEKPAPFRPLGKDQEPDFEFFGRDYSTREPPKAAQKRISDGDKAYFEDLERDVWKHLNKLEKTKKIAAEIKMGKPSASLFDTRDAAAYYGRNVYGLSPNVFRIKQQGNGYYISIPKILDETYDPIRDLAVTTSNKPSDDLLTAFFGSALSPDTYVDPLTNRNRKVITYGPQEMHRLVQEAADNILDLSRTERNELREILIANRDYKFIDDEGQLKRGRFNETFGEFEREFFSRFKKMPSERQIAAYFDYTRYYNMDLAMRDLALVRDMGRLGLERTKVGYHLPDPDDPTQMKRQTSKAFASREVEALPYEDEEDWGVWIYNPHTQKGEFHQRADISSDIKADLNDKVSNHGFKILEIGNPLEKPLLGIAKTDEVINFMVVKDFDKSKYSFSNIPSRPGGHVAYQDEIFAKQPIMRKTSRGWVYEGDETLLNFTTEAQARKVVPEIEKARLLLKQGRYQELDRHLAKNTPYDRETFESYFREKELPDGTMQRPRFSLDHPFTYTAKGRNTFDMSHFKHVQGQYPNFKNAIRSKFNLFANYIDKKYLGSRDPDVPAVLETMKRVDEKFVPEMTLTAPRLIDPYEVVNSSLSNVIRSKYLNDAKMQMVEQFIQAYAPVMKTPIEQLRRNPVHYLHNPDWDTTTENLSLIAHGKHYRQAALHMIGTQSTIGKAMEYTYAKMVDGIYAKSGQSAADYFTDTFRNADNPVDFARQMTFHVKLGLLNPVQFFKQSAAIAHIAAIEGAGPVFNAIPDSVAARWLALSDDPKHIDGVINFLEKQWAKPFNFNGKRFREAYEELRKTGFYNVGGEYASKDDFFDPKVFKSKAGEFLDKTAVTFTEGERANRLVAWFTAYNKWRAANPGKVMNNVERARVLEDADFLTNRMSRASNANIQSGSAAPTFQFFSYKWRMAEALLGRKLTRAQKVRVALTYAGLYGIPVGLSAFTVVDFYDDIRQYMLEEGYDMDNLAVKTLHDGMVGTITSLITGEDYNISQNYGPAGLNVVKELFTSDENKWLEFLLGASGSVTGDMIKTSHGAYDFVMSMVDPNHEAPTAADFVEFTQNISHVNQGIRAYYMMNGSQYITRNETTVLTDSTSTDAMMTYLFGVTPQKAGDTFRMINSLKEQREAEDIAKREAVRYLKRMMSARDQGDVLLAAKNQRLAKAALEAGKVNPDQWAGVLRRAYNGNEALWERVLQDFVEKAPVDQREARRAQAQEEFQKTNQAP